MPIITEMIEDKTARERFGGGDGRAINRHSVRRYDFKAGGVYVCKVELDRNTSILPPAFSVVRIPEDPNFQGILPRFKVMGQEYFADGMSWPRAERLLKDSLDYKYRNGEITGPGDFTTKG